MSTLKKFKNLSDKQVKRIISLFLMFGFGATSSIAVSALSKDVTIRDGEEVTKFRTLYSETSAVLKQAGINVCENDKVVRTDASSKQVDIDIKRAFPVNVFFDGTWHSFSANDGTVGELLAQNNIYIDENFHVSTNLDAVLTPNMQITIAKMIPINLSVDGRNEPVSVPEGTVMDALNFLKISLSTDDIVNEPLDKFIENGLSIVVNRVEFKEFSENEVIPFSTNLEKSDTMALGSSKIETQGVNGEKCVTKRVKYVNGASVHTDILAENILKKPVSQVKIVGTKNNSRAVKNVSIENGTVTDENGEIHHYNKVITGVCTAYTENNGRTSTGVPAQRGIVAVDPKVIPYGTKLYIPGYGLCVAGDTGGAMRQGRVLIDLYMDSESECRQFGRRTKPVYVLD